MAREEKHLDSCLLRPENTKMLDPNGPVLVCGLCPARSDHVGDVGKMCTVP
jgi:hypothetical protein